MKFDYSSKLSLDKLDFFIKIKLHVIPIKLLEEKAQQVPSQPLIRRKLTGPVLTLVGVVIVVRSYWRR